MDLTGSTTVGEIVTGDFRAAVVFDAFGIDFCCGGRRTVAEACRVRHVEPETVLDAVARMCGTPDGSPHFDDWALDTLIAYIIGRHHSFVRQALPQLTSDSQKIAVVHGRRHPEWLQVARLVEEVSAEILLHMEKEERILFPYIVEAAQAVGRGRSLPTAPFESIDRQIQMMEEEHELAGTAMTRIREITADYAVPADGCATYRVCLQLLEAFERDLHAHVHLENNILFPKARALAPSGMG